MQEKVIVNRGPVVPNELPETTHMRSAINAFKAATEDAFHKLSADISNLGRSETFTTDPNERLATMEGLQTQLRNIRNSFNGFNFGLDEPAAVYGGVKSDVVVNRTEYDNGPLSATERHGVDRNRYQGPVGPSGSNPDRNMETDEEYNADRKR